jgi:hypothetical protein
MRCNKKARIQEGRLISDMSEEEMTESAGIMLLEGEEWLQALAMVRKRRGQWDYLRSIKQSLRNMPRNGDC